MKKNLPAMQETWVRSLGWEDLLEKEMATHSSTEGTVRALSPAGTPELRDLGHRGPPVNPWGLGGS